MALGFLYLEVVLVLPRRGLTMRSTRTQPQAAGSSHPGYTFNLSSLISSAAAGPVSLIR